MADQPSAWAVERARGLVPLREHPCYDAAIDPAAVCAASQDKEDDNG